MSRLKPLTMLLLLFIYICSSVANQYQFDGPLKIIEPQVFPVSHPIVSSKAISVPPVVDLTFRPSAIPTIRPSGISDPPIVDLTFRPSAIPTIRPSANPTLFEYPLRKAEYDALYALYNSTNGPHWIWRNISDKSKPWDFNEPNANPCYDNWQGISCKCTALLHECTLVVLTLSKHNMTGSLPPQIGVFKSLTSLDLSINNITNSLPSEIGDLSSLKILSLQNNQFNGSLPRSISNITNLQTLNLHVNLFNGSIPEELYKLSKLKILQLEQNELAGTISESIKNLKELIQLFIQLNSFSGQVPNTIGQLTHLRVVDISTNYFNGTLPSSIGNLKNLSVFIAGGNRIHGTLPYSIGQLERLVLIDLTVNNFTGQIPESVGNLTRLEQFYLNDNQFFGTIPVNFPSSKTKKVFSVDLANNYLTGTIPPSIHYWEKLQFFSVLNNRLDGIYPWNETYFPHLLVFQIGNNHLYGSVPSQSHFNNFTKMISFNVAQNSFTGYLPTGNWTLLTDYVVYGNAFVGSISDILSDSTFLNLFEISNNYLTGTIPTWFASKNQLGYVNMTGNFFTGSLDHLFGDKIFFPDLTQLSLSYNDFTGTIPDTISEISHLHGIFLNDNRLSGTLPASIAQLQELEVLLVQDNQLTGGFPQILNSPSLANVDVSNNLLSGVLPTNFYSNSSLVTLSIGTNCFHGSLPTELCNLRNLEVFAFNGLSTGAECRISLFPGSKLFDSFVLRYEFDYNIPECLFTMPKLQTLHLSGNGLTGSLPSSLNLSESLTDLSLSHNQLTGTIPLYIQERPWSNLDLSYNKFGGTLSSDFHSYDENSNLALNINRLSGHIPSILTSALSINILEGNLFTCELSRSDLPQHDDKADDYSCGSDVANYTLYVWISVFGLVLLLLIIGMNYYHQDKKNRLLIKIRESGLRDSELPSFSKSNLSTKEEEEQEEVEAAQKHGKSFIGFMIRLIIWRRELYNTSSLSESSSLFLIADDGGTSNIKKLTIFLQRVRFLSVLLGGIILFIYLPLYSAIGVYYSQYENKYAWKVSGLLLTGVNAALILEIVLFFLLIFIVSYFQYVFHYNDFDFMRMTSSTFRTSDQIRASSSDSVASSNSTRHGGFPGYRTIISLVIVGLMDFLLMIVVDIAYVSVIITYDTSIIILSEILLALLKTLLNNVLIWRAVPYVKRYLSSSSTSTKPETFVYSRLDISFITVMILLNNIVFPIFAVFIVSPDCFYTALFQPENVSSSYTYTICERYAGRFFVDYCYLYQTNTQESSYNPPFMYNYQCASTIFINYVSVFILMYTAEGIVIPLLKLIIKFINEVDEDEQSGAQRDHEEQQEESYCQSNNSQSSFPHQTANSQSSGGTTQTRNRGQSQGRITMSKSIYNRESVAMGKSLHSRISSLLLPANLKSLSPSISGGKNYQENILFDKNRLAVRLNAYFVVMLSFGALFPPLALIVCVTIFTVTIYEEIVIGRLLYESERLGYVWYKKQLERDCNGIEDSLKYTLWSLVPVSSMLYAYIIFDTWGDEEGWQLALVPAFIMLFVPTILLIALKKHRISAIIWKRVFRWRISSSSASSKEVKPVEEKGKEENNRNTMTVRYSESKESPVMRSSEIEVTTFTAARSTIDYTNNPILVKDIEDSPSSSLSSSSSLPPPPISPSISASPKRVGFIDRTRSTSDK